MKGSTPLWRAVVVGVACAASVLVAGHPADAAPIGVSTTADVVDPGDGVTSLREAFALANATVGDDTIVLQPGVIYAITSGCDEGGIDRENWSGSFDHTDMAGRLLVVGNGSTIEGCAAGAALDDSLVTYGGLGLRLENLTLQGARREAIHGKGKWPTETPHVEMVDVKIRGVSNPGISTDVIGGFASVTLVRSEIAHNDATVGLEGVAVTMVDSTIFDNQGIGSYWDPLFFAPWTVIRSFIETGPEGSGDNTWIRGSDATFEDAHIAAPTNSAQFAVRVEGSVHALRTRFVRGMTTSSTSAVITASAVKLIDSSVEGSGNGVGILTYPGGFELTRSSITGTEMGVYLVTNVGGAGPVETVSSHITDSTVEVVPDPDGCNCTWPQVGIWVPGGGGGGDYHGVDVHLVVERSRVDAGGGRGIMVRGSLELRDSVVTGAAYGTARASDLVGEAAGVTARPSPWGRPSDAVVERSTIADNHATVAGGVGGLACIAMTSCQVRTSTVTGNSGLSGTGGVSGEVLLLEQSTVLDNTGTPAQQVSSAAPTLDRSVVGTSHVPVGIGPAPPACAAGTTVTLGYNVASDLSCGIGSAPGDLPGSGDPHFGPLGNHGGPTPTRVPEVGSPALDRIPATAPGCSGTDQRGMARPQFVGCDSGAVEAEAPRGLFHPVNPVRVLDSRSHSKVGPYGTPWNAGTTRDVQIAGTGGVPADAVAVVLNVTVTSTTAASFLSVWPTGTPQPLVSSLNWTPGQTIPNAVTARLGTNGTINLYNSTGTVDVIIDINGYYR